MGTLASRVLVSMVCHVAREIEKIARNPPGQFESKNTVRLDFRRPKQGACNRETREPMTKPVSTLTLNPEQLLKRFESSVEHHYVTNSGVRLHYAAIGQGPLIVLLHGFPDHWLGWWKLMNALKGGFRLVAPDLRGYNLSDKPAQAQAYAIANLVGDVRSVIEHEGESTAIVAGHDWGGFVAWHVAMDAPELLRGLVILNMPHPWAISRELVKNPLQLKASEYVRLFRQEGAHQHFPLERLSAWVADPAYKKRHDAAMNASSLDAMFNYYRVNWPSEPYSMRTNSPPRLSAPALLIHGLNDPYALPAGLNDVWEWSDKEVEIMTLPGAGHFIQHENATQVTKRLRQWLEQFVT